jgi:predicted enzyme related to lactoylglutathione lyase
MTLIYNHAFITLASHHFERLVSFYQRLLDQSPQPYSPQRYAEFQLTGLRLAIFRPRADHGQEFSPPGSGSMSLCLEVVDLESAIATLTHLGYPPPGPIIDASHGQEIYAYDPAGNRLILHEARAR